MNKYLLVAFYVVAGCSIAIPMEDFDISYSSDQIWIDINSMSDGENLVIYSKSDIAISSYQHIPSKILVSSLFVLCLHKIDVSQGFFDIRENKHYCYTKPCISNYNLSSINIRAPQL